ncbi:beta strand repeat-containing protein [Limnohabitans sp.]
MTVAFDAVNGWITIDGLGGFSAFINEGFKFATVDSYLAITAATEEPDPLLVDASMDYQGVQQQATLTLETGGEDGMYDVPTEGSTTDRLADVHYVGGKSYVSITGAGTDGILGNADDESVVISADMGDTAAETNQNLVDAINAKITGSAPTPPVITIAANLPADANISADGGNAGSGTLTITLNFGSLGVPDVVVDLVQGAPGWAPDGAPFNFSTMQQLLELGIVGGVLGAFPYIASAVVNADGDIVITTKELAPGEWNGLPQGGVLPYLSFSIAINGNVAAELQSFSGEASAGGAPDQVLSQLLESATLDEFGTITLTAKDYAKETFEITDVTLDYQGVQQIATLSLDTDTAYTSSFTDAQTVDNVSFSRGSNVYYQGGKAYVTISGAGTDGLMNTADDTTVTVDALMGEDATTTSQNLVDAINLAINGGSAGGTPPVITIAGDYARDTSLLPTGSGGALYLTFGNQDATGFISFVRSSGDWTVNPGFEGSWTGTFSTLGQLLDIIADASYVDTAIIDANGDIVITGTQSGADTQLIFGVSMSGGLGLDSLFFGGEDFGEGGTLPPDPVLSQILSSAELGADGTITLTAKNAGVETFNVSDVTLDYQGVKQLATITLDGSTSYGSTFTNGQTADNVSYGRGADVYYEGGKIYATISDKSTFDSFTVTSDMVTAPKPASITIDLANPITGASLMGGRIVFNTPGGLGVDATIDARGKTVNAFLTEVQALSFIESATLVDGNIVITAKNTVSELEMGPYDPTPVTIDGAVAVPNSDFSVYTLKGEAITDLAYLNSQALVEAINIRINGTTGSAAVVSVGTGVRESDSLVFVPMSIIPTADPVDPVPPPRPQGIGSFKMNFFYDADGSGSGTALNLEVTAAFVNGTVRFDLIGLDGSPINDTVSTTLTLGNLVSWLNNLESAPNVKSLPVAFAVVNEQLQMAVRDATNTDASIGLKIVTDTYQQIGVNVYSGSDPLVGDADGFYTDTGVASSVGDLGYLLSNATLGQDGTITLTAQNAGEQTFEVSDVTFDYQGQTQQAQATYSTTDADYYTGGSMSLTVDTTPDVAGDTANDVVVTSNMVDGDAAASQQALVDAINALGQSGTPGGPAVLTITRDGGFDGNYTNVALNGSGYFVISNWSLKVVQSSNTSLSIGGTGSLSAITLAETTFPVTVGQNWFDLYDATQFDDLNAFLSHFQEYSAYIASAEIIDGDIVITSKETGDELELIFDWTVNTYSNTGQFLLNSTIPVVQEASALYADLTLPLSDFGTPGTPSTGPGIGGTAALDAATGTITLTSTAKTEQAFSISAATMSDPARAEVTEVTFSSTDADYFDSANDSAATNGTVSVKVLGSTYTVDMVGGSGGALATAQALLAKLQLASPAGLDTTKVQVALSGTTFTFTSQILGTAGALSIDAEATVNGVKQVTEIDLFSGSDNDFIAGIGRDLSIDIAGETFTLDGNTRLEILEDLETQLLNAIAADTNLTGIGAKLEGVSIDPDTLTLTLTARYGGLDTLAVSDLTRPTIDPTGNSAYQVVELFLTDSYLNARTPGQVLKIEMGKTIVSYTVQPGDTGAAILSRLATALDGEQLVGSATVEVLSPTISVIRVTASVFGPNVLGTVSEDDLFNSVRLFTNTSEVGSGFSANEITAGAVTYDFNNPDTIGTVTSVTDGVAPIASDPLADTAFDTTTAAKDVTQEGQTIDNPNAGDNADLFGDSALTGASGVQQDFVNPGAGADTVDGTNSNFYGDSALTGANGLKQNVVNPGVGADTVNGSNATFYGDNALTGSSGVTQFYTNPGNGYDATGGSPVLNTSSANNGDGTLYGSNPGTYTGTTLDTTYLNGGTANGNGGYDYGAAGNPTDNLTIADGSAPADGGTAGQSSSTVTDTTSGSDGLAVTQDKAGFAPFEWDLSLLTVRSTGSSVSDVVNNFQTAYDLVALESALLASTVDGDVTGVEGYATQRLVTTPSLRGGTETQVGFYATEVYYAWELPSVDTPFSITVVQNQYNSNSLGLAEIGGYTESSHPFATGTYSFDNLADFVATLNAASTNPNAPDFTARLGDDGRVILSVPDGYYVSGAGVFMPVVTYTLNEGVAFDLSTTEFGLVDSAESTLNADALSSSTDVAAVLNSVFDFNAAFGGTTDNSEINTTVFGVTAADNPNVTAIWAHTQSSTGDSTVEAHELNLLATVNTLGQEFQLANFLPKPATPVIPV